MTHPFQLTHTQLSELNEMIRTALNDMIERNLAFALGTPETAELLNELTEPLIAMHADSVFPDDDDAINTLDIIFSSMLLDALITAFTSHNPRS